MSRYIDADKLQEEFKELHCGKRSLLIDTQPTADVETVRYGRWEDGNGNLMSWGSHYTFCTNCNEESEYMDRFCGNCGAKMIALGKRFDAKAQEWKEVECEMDEDGTGMDGESDE